MLLVYNLNIKLVWFKLNKKREPDTLFKVSDGSCFNFYKYVNRFKTLQQVRLVQQRAVLHCNWPLFCICSYMNTSRLLLGVSSSVLCLHL